MGPGAVVVSVAGASMLPVGYLMVNSIEIKNFRCYRRLKVDGLKRVNVIVGENGSGKTAFLESIFMAGAGSPEIGIRLQNFRGMGTAHEVSGEGVRSLWRDMFHGFDQSLPVEISLHDHTFRPRSLSISLIEDEDVTLPLNESDESGVVRNLPIEFEWHDGSAIYKSRPTLADGKVTFPSAKTTTRASFFPAQFKLNPEESAKRLSGLSKKDQLFGVVDAINAVYQGVSSISVEYSAGSWQVFAKVDHMPERMPIGLHSAGVMKFVNLILGIVAMEGGCVLIDEVENGFYFDRMESIWRTLYEIAREFKCQLFVTTHSAECLRALSPVVKEHQDSFALLKTFSENGSGKVVVSTGSAMSAALEGGREIR